MEFKIQRLFSENHLRAYFTKYVGWLDGLDFDREVFEYWVTETKSRFIKRKQKELQTLLRVTPGLKPVTVLRSLGRQSERLTNDYITYASTVRRIRHLNNSGFITALNITALSRPGSNLSPRWKPDRQSHLQTPGRSADKWLPQKPQTLQKQDTTTTRQTETTDTHWITWHCYDYCRQTSQQSDWMLPYWASTETDTTFTQQRIETK